MPYVHVHNDDEYKQALESAGDLPVVVKTSAAWCGPCKAIAPYFENLANDFKDIHFISLDVDDCELVSEELGITALPTFISFLKGEEKQRLRGATKNRLKEMVESLN